MKFHYQKNYVDCDCMTKQDYNSVRGLHGQAQETKGSKQRTLLQSKWYSQKKKKKKDAVWSWVGGSQEYI